MVEDGAVDLGERRVACEDDLGAAAEELGLGEPCVDLGLTHGLNRGAKGCYVLKRGRGLGRGLERGLQGAGPGAALGCPHYGIGLLDVHALREDGRQHARAATAASTGCRADVDVGDGVKDPSSAVTAGSLRASRTASRSASASVKVSASVFWRAATATR